jgi:lysozyme family protein
MADYPEDFLKAVNDLIDNWEGGYVDDPQDPGGETKYGISKRAYPNVDIKNLTRDGAITLYFYDYWQKYFAWIADPDMRAKAFNMGVLMGPQTALIVMEDCSNIDEYRQACERHFQAIVIKHPVCAKYLKGWTRRALA